MKIHPALKLIIAIAVSNLAGAIGALFTTSSVEGWYGTIAKPSFNPPSWVFGPVWTTLFVLMGIAAFLIWQKGLSRKDVRIALGVFLGHLVLNTMWSIIFFGMENPGGALIEIAFLWISIVITMILFYRISKPAMYLMAPYIAWVSFAMYLNYSIYVLN